MYAGHYKYDLPILEKTDLLSRAINKSGHTVLQKIPVLFTLLFLAGCANLPFAYQRGNSVSLRYQQSERISIDTLQRCTDTRCLIELAKQENKKSSAVNTQLGNAMLAETLFMFDAEKEALDTLSTINDSKVLSAFYGGFGSISKGKINKFLADTQRWENVEVPLPKSLLGRNVQFDNLYVMLLIINQQFELATKIADELPYTLAKNQIYLNLTKALLKKKRYEDAWDMAYKIKGDSKEETGRRAQAVSHVLFSLYRYGDRTDALNKLSNIYSLPVKNGGRIAIAMAMAAEGDVEPALKLLDRTNNRGVKQLGYNGILQEVATRGDLKMVEQLLTRKESSTLPDAFYSRLITSFTRSKHVDEAVRFLDQIPTDKAMIYALSELGRTTKNITYFQQALILAKKLNSEKGKPWMQGSVFISGDMAGAGYAKEAILTLHENKQKLIRILIRPVIFTSLFNSGTAPKDYDDILDLAELDMDKSTYMEFNQILSMASRFFIVEKGNPAAIERYLRMVNQVMDQKDRELLRSKVIPHLAFLGEFERVNQIIANMDYTVPRIAAMMRLAKFHILKKNLNTI